MARRKRTPRRPGIGELGRYTGRSSNLLRGGHTVRVVAEACGGRVLVEAIGYKGRPVRFTVSLSNLEVLDPGLFDPPHADDEAQPGAAHPATRQLVHPSKKKSGQIIIDTPMGPWKISGRIANRLAEQLAACCRGSI